MQFTHIHGQLCPLIILGMAKFALSSILCTMPGILTKSSMQSWMLCTHVHSQLCPLIILGVAFQDGPHIILAKEAQQAALLVHQGVHLFGAFAQQVLDVQYHSWIQVSAPGSHHQPANRELRVWDSLATQGVFAIAQSACSLDTPASICK